MSICVFCSLSFSILLVICGKIVTLMLLKTAKMLIGCIVSTEHEPCVNWVK